jgi:hypothetical protein
MSVTSPDFESGAYTNFATPASRGEIIKPVALRRNYVDQPGSGSFMTYRPTPTRSWAPKNPTCGPGYSTTYGLETRIVRSPPYKLRYSLP